MIEKILKQKMSLGDVDIVAAYQCIMKTWEVSCPENFKTLCVLIF